MPRQGNWQEQQLDNHKRQGKTKKKWLKKPNDKNSKKRPLERRLKPRMFLKAALTS